MNTKTPFHNRAYSKPHPQLGMAIITPLILVAAIMPVRCQANPQIYKETLPATAWILTSDAMGSGVLISTEERLVITNQHVVGSEIEVRVVFPVCQDKHWRSERQYYVDRLDQLAIVGRVLATDVDRDLALVQVSRLPTQVHEIKLGQSVHPGDEVHSLGNPGTSDALWIYTYGKVRSVYYKTFRGKLPHRMEVVEISSPINPGDSGGPIVNNRGQLVAISQSYLIQGRLVSYGVNVSEISWFLEKVKRGKGHKERAPVPTTDKPSVTLANGFRLASVAIPHAAMQTVIHIERSSHISRNEDRPCVVRRRKAAEELCRFGSGV